MSNPTSNFGWQMPTATDLVTDLPADFEVFGQAVDTDFADLNGGTTGQILSKTSATDLDFTWINNDQGDITGVTAGTGISGGGTSGTVTVTNSMATAFTTSGDLIQATGSGTFARLGTGTNGQYLTTNGTTNSWAGISAGGMTLLTSGNLSGSVVTLSSISADYIHLYLQINDFYPSTDSAMYLRPNDLTSGYLNLGDGNSGGTAFEGTASVINSHWEDSIKSADNNNAISFFIWDYTNTIATKTAQVYSKFPNASNVMRISQLISLIPTTSAISSFTITTVSGTFSGGSYKLYGVK